MTPRVIREYLALSDAPPKAPAQRPAAVLMRHTLATLVAFRHSAITEANALRALEGLGWAPQLAVTLLLRWGYG